MNDSEIKVDMEYNWWMEYGCHPNLKNIETETYDI